MAQINYHHLYYFFVTAREGSIVSAARSLHVTPQTVSGQIATFEDYLGIHLFDRRGKRLYVSEQGKVAYQYAQEIFSLGEELLNTLKLKSTSQINRFTLAVTDVIPKVLAFDLIQPVMQGFENTRLVYREGDFESLLADLAVNKVDLILSDRPLSPSTNLKAFSHLLGDTGIAFFASKQVAGSLEHNFPACLNNTPLLIPSDKSTLRGDLLSWFEAESIYPKIVGEFDDSAVAKLFGQQGFGLFCAPECITAHVEQKYDVCLIGTTKAVRERIYLITPERKIRSEIALRIVSHAAKIFVNNG
jgi:LysR family transcriptional activator of nhaA